MYSPRRRGWTRVHLRLLPCQSVFPAEAGVNLMVTRFFWTFIRIPRGGGGEPNVRLCNSWRLWYSPRRRGWTWYPTKWDWNWPVFPAEAGVNLIQLPLLQHKDCIPRGGGGEPEKRVAFGLKPLYSPRRRGWTWTCGQGGNKDLVFPAEAGGEPFPGIPSTCGWGAII